MTNLPACLLRILPSYTALLAGLVLTVALASPAGAQAPAPDSIVFSTDWLAEAEHGGFYQAVAEGIYRKYNLDVTVKMGGPQVNGLQLVAAGQFDVALGDGLQVLAVVEQGVPLTAIAATFQKNPTVLIAHPGVTSLADLKGKPVALAASANTTFWPWLKLKYGYTDAQKRPYAFSVQPFLVDPTLSQQGFVTSEPFTIEKAGIHPQVFLLTDMGYPPYSQTLIVTRDAATRRRDALARFVRASAEGWKSYLANPAPGNVLIKQANPQMTDELLAYGWRKMKEYKLLDGGAAAQDGLLSMTAAHWQATVDFLHAAGLAKPQVDYSTAWNLSVAQDVHVIP